MLIEYDSTNSGGYWWLSDKDWKKLENAGWKVFWYSEEKPRKDCEYCQGTGKMTEKGVKDRTFIGEKDIGKRCYGCLSGGKDGRFLGALATKAEKKFKSIREALIEFEKITGQDVSEEGCNCCGPPHSFEWNIGKKWNYTSGEECLKYLFPDKKIPKTKRELLENQ